VTISFRQFGVQIHFLPTITPRGTIRLHLSPEVSSLDFANALTANGSVVPALNTRKVETDIELESGQTFAIAGLLDQRTTESLSKIPGLADIPILGKLFTSKNINVSNSELLIIVTPEIVGPIANPRDIPALVQPLQFMQGKGILSDPPRTPGTDITGPAPEKPKRIEIPIQEMEKFQTEQSRPSGGGMTAGLPRSAGGPAPDITTGGGAPPAPAAETASSPSGLSVGSAPALRIKP
jgi:pilus assembly protein CpaC